MQEERYNPLNINDSWVQAVYSQYNNSSAAKYVSLDIEDVRKGFCYFLLFLREAVMFKNSKIFVDNVLWFLRTNANKPISQLVAADILEKIKDGLGKTIDPSLHYQAMEMIDAILKMMPVKQNVPGSYLSQPGVDRENSSRYLASLIALDGGQAEGIIRECQAKGLEIKTIYQKILQPVQYEIGRLWESGELTVAEEHFCTENTRNIAVALMTRKENPAAAPVFIGACVENELHSLGIQMVCDYFTLDGWNSIFLGADLPSGDELTNLIEKSRASVVGIAVTMPYHIHKAEALIRRIRSNVQFSQVKVIVGGFAFNNYPDLYIKVGADFHAKDAQEAVNFGRTWRLSAQSKS